MNYIYIKFPPEFSERRLAPNAMASPNVVFSDGSLRPPAVSAGVTQRSTFSVQSAPFIKFRFRATGQLGAVGLPKTPIQGQLGATRLSKTPFQGQLGAARLSKRCSRANLVPSARPKRQSRAHLAPSGRSKCCTRADGSIRFK